MITNIRLPEYLHPDHSLRQDTLKGLENRDDYDYPDQFYYKQDVNGWDLSDHALEVDIDEIRHMSVRKCDKFIITADQPGNYMLKCEMICEELSEPQTQEIKVVVMKA